MTEKQERILQSALQLFATQGYASTATSKVARSAGVSEGLIFRHFGSKEGLLEAVVENGMARLKHTFANVVLAADPREVIRRAICLPFEVSEDDHEFWRLTYALKWQSGQYALDVSEPMLLALSNAFRKTGASHPDAEAQLLMATLDGIATMILLHPAEDIDAVKHALLSRYGVD